MSETPAPVRPLAIWIVYLILFLQGAAVILFILGSLLTSEATVLDTAGQVALVVLYLLAGVVLIILGFRIFLGASGARTPVMVLQLLLVILSISFFTGGTPLVGVIFLVPSATVLVLLFAPAAQNWLEANSGPRFS